MEMMVGQQLVVPGRHSRGIAEAAIAEATSVRGQVEQQSCLACGASQTEDGASGMRTP